MSVATATRRALPTVLTVGSALTIEELLEATELPDAVVLDVPDQLAERDCLVALRNDSRFALKPLFVNRPVDQPDLSLADGNTASMDSLHRQAADIAERCSTLARDVLADPESRLLAFLHTRPGRMLAPYQDWRSEHLYRYPLLDAFDGGMPNSSDWLTTLLRRRLLEPVALVDRIRACPDCQGAHFSYIDQCTSCASIDISETIFLHCYCCGHVATQDAYIAGDGMRCPKCQTQLRHIGVDYDRALETYQCATCTTRFAQPDIRARCLHCDKRHATLDLPERRIHSYKLSSSGALAARTGNVGDLFALIDDLNYAHLSYFERTLDWQLDLRRRHREVEFGVVCIRLSNIRELIDATSRARAAQIIDAFALRLRELIRSTDLLTRSDDQHCWLFLPQTPPSGLAVLRERIEALPALVSEAGGSTLSIAVSTFASNEMRDGKMPATLLMSELRGALS
ncbi:MAG: diguanylate cyclase [Proteobacteria bacterium]|nr:diguanylate cyclase [Pseudomonadota bacterium]